MTDKAPDVLARYGLVWDYTEQEYDIKDSINGDFVRYEDHQRVVDALKEQVSASDDAALDMEAKLAASEAKCYVLESLVLECRCPHCDGSGAIPVSEDEWQQCQWCYEKQQALRDCGEGE